jgi:hypothetical protein
MTVAPNDLLALRSGVMTKTGLSNPVQVGIVGDGAHQRTGGYHEGRDVLVANGMFGPVGSLNTDYSVRLQSDHDACTNSASAMDIGYQWPNGGNAAWLRFNNTLATALRNNDSALFAIRAINYTPDGSTLRRIDRQYGFSTQSTSDSVNIHTHIEWYRASENNRQACINRLLDLITHAINNTNPFIISEDDNDMGAIQGPFKVGVDGHTSLTVAGVEAGLADPRPTWLNICNDTDGRQYALRIYITSGNGAFGPLQNADGVIKLSSGARYSKQLPAGVACVSLSRSPSDAGDVYAGDLTVCFERGALQQ